MMMGGARHCAVGQQHAIKSEVIFRLQEPVCFLIAMLRFFGARFFASAQSVNVKITYCGG
jgi:hypothetical protein